MQYRTFRDGTSLSVLAVGCGRVGSLNNPTPIGEIRRTLATAAENGVNVFDTADIYGQGDSERELGRVMARYRDTFVITKAGYTQNYTSTLVRFAKPILRPIIRHRGQSRVVAQVRGVVGDQDFTPARLRGCVENSLKRLQADRLPGFLLHDPPVGVLKDQQIAALLADLEREGKISAYGASVRTLDEAEAAIAIPGLSLLQIPGEVLDAMDASLLQTVRSRGIAMFVRQILNRQACGRPSSIDEALRAILSHNVVTSTVVGISRQTHLATALQAVQ